MSWEAIGWMATGAVICMGIQVIWKHGLRGFLVEESRD